MTKASESMTPFFHDHSLRMMGIYLLGCMRSEILPETVGEALLEDEPESTLKRLFPCATREIDDAFECNFTGGELFETIVSHGYIDYLTCIVTPVDRPGGWGVVRHEWGYGESPKDSIRSALQQVDILRSSRWNDFEPVTPSWDEMLRVSGIAL